MHRFDKQQPEEVSDSCVETAKYVTFTLAGVFKALDRLNSCVTM